MRLSVSPLRGSAKGRHRLRLESKRGADALTVTIDGGFVLRGDDSAVALHLMDHNGNEPACELDAGGNQPIELEPRWGPAGVERAVGAWPSRR